MRVFLWSALSLVLGLAIGFSVPIVPGKVPTKGSDNYVNLACLYTLSKSYEEVHGKLPSTINELKTWCESDEIKRAMMEKIYHVRSGYTPGTKPWIFSDNKPAKHEDEVFISSGPIVSESGRSYMVSVTYAGDIKVQSSNNSF